MDDGSGGGGVRWVNEVGLGLIHITSGINFNNIYIYTK